MTEVVANLIDLIPSCVLFPKLQAMQDFGKLIVCIM